MAMRFFILSTLILFLLTPLPAYARTTPADIVNSEKGTYNSKVANYSAADKQKLTLFSQKIADLNKQETDLLEQNMLRQGDILDEYVRRNNIVENGGADGIHRDLTQPVNNARYYITYAHEAVAYQAAKIYIINLTSEANLKSDILSTINELQSDINTLKQKVVNSQNVLLATI